MRSYNLKLLFGIDAAGALLTALLLFGVLPKYPAYFGMPSDILTLLSAIAFIFCMYSTACYLWVQHRQAAFMRAISMANLLYCGLTLALLIGYYPRLTIYDIAYFLGEIAIVCTLVYLEMRAVRHSKSSTR